MLTEQQIWEEIEKLTLDQLCGQVLCYNLVEKNTPLEQVEEMVKNTMPGGVWIGGQSLEYHKGVIAALEKYCPVPAILTMDAESGPWECIGSRDVALTSAMGLGAADDPELVEKAYELTAKICRAHGTALALAPNVDMAENFLGTTNNRAISDYPDHVIKIGRAEVRGFQKDGMMAACCKHFPGSGDDIRNSHFLTTVNNQTKEQWMNTTGRIYKAMIEEGVMAIMPRHTAFPAYDEPIDGEILGCRPATLSKNILTGLLKETLGFDGCIVSDALAMIGCAAVVPLEKLAVEYLKAGGDMILFPLPRDFDYIKAAVESGELSIERLKDAVTRIWRLKNQVHLFDEKPFTVEMTDALIQEFSEVSEKLAEKAITVLRDVDHLLPANGIKAGSKVLQVVVEAPDKPEGVRGLPIVEEELKRRGVLVTTLINPDHHAVEDAWKNYDYVLFNANIGPDNYPVGSMRIGWVQAFAMWRGFLLKHPRLIMASFGDPYKLFDYPYIKTYMNVYYHAPACQRAYVRVLCGEVPVQGKSPVALEGYFDREV